MVVDDVNWGKEKGFQFELAVLGWKLDSKGFIMCTCKLIISWISRATELYVLTIWLNLLIDTLFYDRSILEYQHPPRAL